MTKLEQALTRALDVIAYNSENLNKKPITLNDYHIFIDGDDEPIEIVFCHESEKDALEDYNTNYASSDVEASYAKVVL